MRVPADLHPEDLKIRLALSRTLRRAREIDQLYARNIAEKLGVTRRAVTALESSSNWEARTVMRYARAIGWRIEWTLHDLVPPGDDDDDIMAIIIAALDTSTGERVDAAHWRTVWNTMRRIRRNSHITAVALAARLGATENAVHWAETNTDGSSVIAAQRHARALDGRLTWRLHPIGVNRAGIGRPVTYDQIAV